MTAVEYYSLYFQIPVSHIFCRQDCGIDSSKPCVRYNDGGKVQFPDQVFQKYLNFTALWPVIPYWTDNRRTVNRQAEDYL